MDTLHINSINVLHVDDEDSFLDLLKTIIEDISEGNINVTSLSNPEEVLQKLSKNSYDVIVSDYQMRPIDGLELLSRLQRDSLDIPFIMMTGRGRETVAIEALNRGATQYIKKGDDIDAQFKELYHAIINIVKQKRIQDKLHFQIIQNTHLVQDLIDNMPAAIYVKDLKSKHLYVNKGFEFATHIPRSQVINKTNQEIFSKVIANTFDSNDQDIIKLKGPKQFEEKIHIDNKLHVFNSIKFPFLDANGYPYAICGISLDITKQKRIEEDLQSKSSQLQRSMTELEEIVYILAHDLQEPLITIDNHLSLMQKNFSNPIGERAETSLKLAIKSSKRVQYLIGDMLSYAGLKTEPQNYDQIKCVLLLFDVLQNIKSIIENTNAIVTHDTLPSVYLHRSQIGQVFQILITNAIKFCQNDKPKVHISVKKKKHEWLFSIKDNGIGIDPQEFENIFVLFHRLHSNKVYPETGVGLAMCKKIIELHGGKIWVESILRQGSTFYFNLPR